MSDVFVVVEGKTEKAFIDEILAPALHNRGVYLYATIVKKPGENGGDIKFSRVKHHIGNLLKQQKNTYVTLLIDFYGIKSIEEWPGLIEAKNKNTPERKLSMFKEHTAKAINGAFPECMADHRFIPYVAMHEFEAMLFSDPDILAERLQVEVGEIMKILEDCKEPENINDSPQTSPSHRLQKLSDKFKKTTTGIAIAREIGINTIRKQCPLFNQWFEKLEALGED